MSLPATPNPFPTLREGLALGAREHSGFVNVWNWLCNIMRNAKEYFTFGVNGRSGDINVVAGEGINVTTEGQTIMISVGTGENTDNDNSSDYDYGGGYDFDNGRDINNNSGNNGYNSDWTDTPLPDGPSSPPSQCNNWSDEGDSNGWGDSPDNVGDNCNELNGW